MSLTTGKAAFIIDLMEIFNFESQATENPTASRERLAQKLADAIDKFIRTGDVKVNVTTSGTATSQAGTGTGNIT